MRKISSLALAFGFVVSMSACPGDDGTTSDTISMPTTTDPTGTDPTGTDPTGTDPTGTDPTGTDPDTGTGPGGAGFCAATCAAAADCGMPEADWACTDGFCEYTGEPVPCDPAMCDDLMIGACADVDGVSVCTFPCTDGGGECDAFMLECTGTDDAGNSICAAPPCLGAGEGEACEIEGFGSFGTCTDGMCTCMGDEECTADGLACNN